MYNLIQQEGKMNIIHQGGDEDVDLAVDLAEDVARLESGGVGDVVYSPSSPGTPRDAGDPAPVFDHGDLAADEFAELHALGNLSPVGEDELYDCMDD